MIAALQPPDAMQVDFDPSFIILHIDNDTSGPAEMTISNAYVDSKPLVGENAEPIAIERRGAVEIRLSDVASSYVEAGNSYFFATVGPKG